MDGTILWLTGLSGSGKTTLATAVATRLRPWRPVEILDGDEIRKQLSPDLGFTREDRELNVWRIGFVARLLARHGVLAIAAAISPYASSRDEIRRLAANDGVRFVEVFLDAELQCLVDRDIKGLYKRALAGELANFSGISDPYEAPTHPEIVVRTDRESPDVSAQKIVDALFALGVVRNTTTDQTSSV
jgi:adenylyl-sulfate kinase